MTSENSILKIAVIASCLTHGFIFLQRLPSSDALRERLVRKIEISYVKPEKEAELSAKVITPKRESLAKLPSQVFLQKISPPRYEENDAGSAGQGQVRKLTRPTLPKRTEFAKPAFPKPDIMLTKRKVTLSAIAAPEADKIKNPVYLNYYQFVREKIKKAAYQNYVHTEEGEVYLSFSVEKGGSLKGVRLAEEKSSGNEYLRGIALSSIKDAAPFPPFPRELDYPELTFNVIISFEIE